MNWKQRNCEREREREGERKKMKIVGKNTRVNKTGTVEIKSTHKELQNIEQEKREIKECYFKNSFLSSLFFHTHRKHTENTQTNSNTNQQ